MSIAQSLSTPRNSTNVRFLFETLARRLALRTSSLLAPGLTVALAAGLAGGLFARLIVVSTRGLPDRFSRWRREHPLRFAAGCAFGVALIGLVTGGATAGAGYAPTRALLEGHAQMTRDEEVVAVTTERDVAAPEGADAAPLEDRVLRALAERGELGARDAASALGIPLRTAQAALARLSAGDAAARSLLIQAATEFRALGANRAEMRARTSLAGRQP